MAEMNPYDDQECIFTSVVPRGLLFSLVAFLPGVVARALLFCIFDRFGLCYFERTDDQGVTAKNQKSRLLVCGKP